MWANALDDIPYRRWAAVGTNTIRSVVPVPTPAGPNQGPDGITHAWNGCIFDTQRGRYVCWGGGHASYGGNEIYAFPVDTLTWTRVWGPSPSSGGYDPFDLPMTNPTCPGVYSDGSIDARHNYDGIAYLPPPYDKYFAGGGSRYCESGGAANDAWLFNPVTLAWTKNPQNPPTNTFVDNEMVSAWDSTLGVLWFCWPRNGDPCSSFNPSTNTFTQRTDAGPDYGKSKLVYDSTRQRLMAVGGGNPSYGWNPVASGAMNRYVVTHSGNATCTTMMTQRPGVQYDPVIDRYVAWSGGSTVCLGVYTSGTNVDWSIATLDAGNTVTPSAGRTGGTYGAFQRVPSKPGVYLVLNDIDESVYAFRLYGAVGGETLPTLADELAAYSKWGLTCLNTGGTGYGGPYPCLTDADFPQGDVPFTSMDFSNIHQSSEGDDLWTYLWQYIRTSRANYLTRVNGWRNWWVSLTVGSGTQWNTDAGTSGFEMDHINCIGLVMKYQYDGDAAALAKAVELAGQIKTFYDPKPITAQVSTGNGLRGFGRHAQCIIRLAEVTGDVQWVTLRDKLVQMMLNTSSWQTVSSLVAAYPSTLGTLGLPPVGGMYFMNQTQTDARLPAGSYALGGRITAGFHPGIMAEAMWQAWRVTGNTQIRDRILEMAAYVDAYGLDTSILYTGNSYGIHPTCGIWHSYRGCTAPPFTGFADPNYTISNTNLLVMASELTTGTTSQYYYDRAQYFWRRTAQANYNGLGQPNRIPDGNYNHYQDVKTASGDGHDNLDYNKGELQYTWRLFKGGGRTLGGGVSDTTAPTIPENLSVLANGTTITLTWTACTDDSGTATVNIKRSVGTGTTPVAYTTDTAPPFDDTNLTPTTVYRYRISCSDPSGNTSADNTNGIQEATTGSPPPPSAPIAAYDFGTNQGTSVVDNSGNGNTGTLINGPIWTSGQYNYAVDFDGANDVMLVTTATTIDNQHTFEVNGWLRPQTLGGLSNGRIFHKGTSSVRKKLYQCGTASVCADINRATNNATFTAASNSLPLNEWSYIRFTYSPTDGPRFYRGATCGSITEVTYASRNAGTNTTASEAGQPAYFGNNPAGNEGFDGTMDNLRWYSYIRTVGDAQIDCQTAIIVPSSTILRAVPLMIRPGIRRLR